jgi:hypothetical protein
VKIEFIKKTGNSWSGNCPAIYHVTSEEGGFVVQGKQLRDETQPQLGDLGLGETGVWVPSDVIDDYPAIERVTAEDGGFVVRGQELDDETRAQLRDLGLDETGVWVAPTMIDR